ncbi:MAG: hypothetical protein DMG65_06590 [Candidatus Angelobacter sp. Gp1-AA117]|nr:MAG: hypothetical protein DMG65_06590 [Candidatus Angelobacter sp. Gp1-AA117]
MSIGMLNVAFMAKDLSLPADDIYSRTILSEVRNNLGTDLLVLGSFAVWGEKGDQKIRIDLRIVNATSGETLGSRSETSSAKHLLDFVGSLGSQLREELRLSQLSPAQVKEARGMVPKESSVAPLYIEAIERLHQFDREPRSSSNAPCGPNLTMPWRTSPWPQPGPHWDTRIRPGQRQESDCAGIRITSRIIPVDYRDISCLGQRLGQSPPAL